MKLRALASAVGLVALGAALTWVLVWLGVLGAFGPGLGSSKVFLTRDPLAPNSASRIAHVVAVLGGKDTPDDSLDVRIQGQDVLLTWTVAAGANVGLPVLAYRAVPIKVPDVTAGYVRITIRRDNQDIIGQPADIAASVTEQKK